ncbi:MAG: efflux RND transporter periplasmic adaptor subunit [Patescibacteria group bacterium]|nr:efflux RND transporter periplasmic adaptor subunit [Patescibacteria group bacterium]
MIEEKRRKHIKKQNIIAASIIVVGTILSLLVFGPDKSKSQEPAPQEIATFIETITIGEDETDVAVLQKTATFVSINSADMTAENSGRIRNVNFEVGNYVSKGQILAIFDQSNTENSAKVSLESAQRTLEFANKSLKKIKDLVDKNEELTKNARKIAEIQLDQAKDGGDKDAIALAKRSLENAKDLEDQTEENSKLQLLSAEQQISRARTGIEQAQIAFENTIIKASISGLIVSKNVNNDQYINAGDIVAQIVGPGKLESVVSLNENQINRIQTGDEVTLSFSNQQAMGEIIALSSIANPSNNRFDVTIQSIDELSSQSHKTAQIDLQLKTVSKDENIFFVPLSAVSIGQQTNTVFIEQNKQAKTVEVELGESIGDQVEITNGLNKGDRLITKNNRGLREGESVTTESLNN